LAYGIENAFVRSNTLCLFAQAEAGIGRVEEARRILQTLPEMDDTVSEAGANRDKALAMIAIGRFELGRGRREEALAALGEAVGLMKTANEFGYSGVPLTTIARTQIEAGDLDAAAATFAMIAPNARGPEMRFLAADFRRAGNRAVSRTVYEILRRDAEAR